MSNSFYNHSGWPATRAAGASSSARAELALIAAGFDKMPTLAGNGLELLRINAAGTAIESVAAIDGIPIGATTPSSGAFTTLSSSGHTSLGDAIGDTLTVSGNVIKNTTDNWSLASPSSGVTLTANGTGNIVRITTTTARGSGAASLEFFDPTGRKAAVGYYGADDVLDVVNFMNAGMELATNSTVPLRSASWLRATGL